MDEFEFKRIIYDYIKEICHYSQMQVFATSSYQKNYFQLQIDEAINGLINLFQDYYLRAAMENQYYTVQQQEDQTDQVPREQMQFNQIQAGDQGQQPAQPAQPVPPAQPVQPNQPAPSGQPNQAAQPAQNVPPLQPAPQPIQQGPKQFTAEELAAFNGSGGKPAYVAVNGTVYDVSNLIGWGGGTHFGQYSGKDLTDVFMGCHNGMFDILNNVPKVGTLTK